MTYHLEIYKTLITFAFAIIHFLENRCNLLRLTYQSTYGKNSFKEILKLFLRYTTYTLRICLHTVAVLPATRT